MRHPEVHSLHGGNLYKEEDTFQGVAASEHQGNRLKDSTYGIHRTAPCELAGPEAVEFMESAKRSTFSTLVSSSCLSRRVSL
jgi:hypothetical protein